MKKRIDLHVHSNCSDGTCTPQELAALAAAGNVCAFALTDHDTTEGVEEAAAAAAVYGIEVIPGIELSTSYHGMDIHILGLGIDIHNMQVQTALAGFQSIRRARNLAMMERMQEMGIGITDQKMADRFPDAVWTRAHFARFLMEHGYVAHLKEAFSKYLGDHASCYVPWEKPTPFLGIQAIHEGGGYAVLAHPLLYKLSTSHLETIVEELGAAGLDGLEAMYSANKKSEEARMKRLAKKYDLKLSGGSDFHGSNKPNIQMGTGKGNLHIPYEVWTEIQR